MSNFLWTGHFRDLPLICHRASKLRKIARQIPEDDSPYEIIS